jgi:hypothetical protein
MACFHSSSNHSKVIIIHNEMEYLKLIIMGYISSVSVRSTVGVFKYRRPIWLHAAFNYFLGAFTILWKATAIFVMFVFLAIRLHGRTRRPLDGFSWNLVFQRLSTSYRKKLQSYWNMTRITGTLHEDLSASWNENCVFLKKSLKIKTHFKCYNIFPIYRAV